MNIFSELKMKIMGYARKNLDEPNDTERPQDDVPDERVLHYIVRDYRRLFHERLALITYIRRLENIYKVMQGDIFKLTVNDISKLPNKKRMVAELRLTLYNTTKEHVSAQKQLMKMINGKQEKGEDNDTTDNE